MWSVVMVVFVLYYHHVEVDNALTLRVGVAA